jgi:hypothetical protein
MNDIMELVEQEKQHKLVEDVNGQSDS